MLAEERRGAPDRGRRRRQLERHADLAERAEERMVDLDVHLAGPRLVRFERLEDVLDRAAGISAASRRSSQAAVGSPTNRAARIGRSSSRFATRSPFVAKRGSAASAVNAQRGAEPAHWRSLPTATAIWPSAVANVS